MDAGAKYPGRLGYIDSVLKYPNQPDSISFGNLYIKYREDPKFIERIRPPIYLHLESLVRRSLTREEENLESNRSVEARNNIFYGGPVGIIAHAKDPGGEPVDFIVISYLDLQDLWRICIDIMGWQNDALPARFLKHSVSDREILWDIMIEMGYFKLYDKDISLNYTTVCNSTSDTNNSITL